MDTKVFEMYESQVRSYSRRFPAVFEKAKGSYLYDETGKEYLDFFDGAGAENYGHNNDEIKSSVIEYLQNDGIIHALDMYTGPKRDFIAFFEEEILKPRGLNYSIMFTGPTGANAVEAALKLARKVKKRSQVWALMGAFHGMTLGAIALTTDRGPRMGAGVPLNNVTHIPAPYMFSELNTIEYMETLINDDHSGVDKPAALFIETIQAEGGVYVFDSNWLKRVREFCDKNDILLVVDDIQVGCARSGRFFSFERAGIIPDIITLSKSIGGYGFPFAITLMKPELDIWEPGEHNGTFRGNQLAFVAAKKGLEFMLHYHIEEETERKGSVVREFLENEIAPLDTRLSYRGMGLIWGIDFSGLPNNRFCVEVQKECFENGLVIESSGRCDSVLKILPPLTITDEELRRGLEILKSAIDKSLVAMTK